jgi:hypothetical protein
MLLAEVVELVVQEIQVQAMVLADLMEELL